MSDRKFVTRGALMQCDKGSHCRRLNLINGHGFEMCIEGRTGESGESMNENGKRHPFLLDTDTVVATEEMPGTEQQNIRGSECAQRLPMKVRIFVCSRIHPEEHRKTTKRFMEPNVSH